LLQNFAKIRVGCSSSCHLTDKNPCKQINIFEIYPPYVFEIISAIKVFRGELRGCFVLIKWVVYVTTKPDH
jgi:hypothetical protein